MQVSDVDICMEGAAIHWNRERKRSNDGRVEWEVIDEILGFVHDSFEFLDLYMEMSSMQLDIEI